jgi:hypothetical protein
MGFFARLTLTLAFWDVLLPAIGLCRLARAVSAMRGLGTAPSV